MYLTGSCLSFPYIGFGWSEHDEDSPLLVSRKWSLKEQATCMDTAVIGKHVHTIYMQEISSTILVNNISTDGRVSKASSSSGAGPLFLFTHVH